MGSKPDNSLGSGSGLLRSTNKMVHTYLLEVLASGHRGGRIVGDYPGTSKKRMGTAAITVGIIALRYRIRQRDLSHERPR
jgi:hypothetical protein